MTSEDIPSSHASEVTLRHFLGAERFGMLRAIAERLGLTPLQAVRECVEREAGRMVLRSDSRAYVAPARAADAVPATAGEKLAQYRLILRLSSEAMAGFLGCAVATYRKYQAGSIRTPIDVLQRARVMARAVTPIDPDAGAVFYRLPGVRPAWDGRGRPRVPVTRETAVSPVAEGDSNE